MAVRTVLVADIGKSKTRLAICRDGVLGREVKGAGIAGLATSSGLRDALERFDALQAQLNAHSADAQLAPDAVAIGVAGALTAPGVAEQLARALADRCDAPASVASDVVTAHLGALDGESGAVLVAGTGAVAFGVSGSGDVEIVDGLGPDLGDHGSGYWIGRAGLRAALRRPNETVLGEAAGALLGGRPPSVWLASQAHPIASIASFAPEVLAAAHHGDAVSLDIVARAVGHLARSASAASSGSGAVSVLGGLASHSWFLGKLVGALEQSGLTHVHSRGNAMQGAALAASRTDLPHEGLIHRAV